MGLSQQIMAFGREMEAKKETASHFEMRSKL